MNARTIKRVAVLAGCAASIAFMASSAGTSVAGTATNGYLATRADPDSTIDPVTSAEVFEALAALDYEMRFRRIVGTGNEQAIVGRSTDKLGNQVDFVVQLAATSSWELETPRPLIPYVEYSGEGLGNVQFVDNSYSYLPGLTSAERAARGQMGYDIKKAVFKLTGLPSRG